MANTGVANGSPTKDFFVEMLTRDIELMDAILDLLDNSLDGVVRQESRNNDSGEIDYKKYYSNITINENSFVITDNCGGISWDTAQRYAFRVGGGNKADEKVPTIGVYGIGMKRAIFKMGREAEVLTRNGDRLFSVTIPKEWSANESDWNFTMTEIEDDAVLPGGGTKVTIKSLTNDIKELWMDQESIEDFCKDLRKRIGQSYAMILSKGFKIAVNETTVKPEQFTLKVDKSKSENVIKPWLFQGSYDEDVIVKIAVGFYDIPPSDEMIEEENRGERTSADAGWSVICNDRVVLFNDKSTLTGWGTPGIPKYHTQFIGIKGVVSFQCEDPKKLPMTTTKRGIDTSSQVYEFAKVKMNTGIKQFITYTNNWKGYSQFDKERCSVGNIEDVNVEDLFKMSKEEIENKLGIKYKETREGLEYAPHLPRPERKDAYRTIQFKKEKEKVEELQRLFIENNGVDLSLAALGENCFDYTLSRMKAEEGERH